MYTRSIIAGILSVAVVATAAPLITRQSNAYTSNGASSGQPQAQPIATVLPDFTSQYTASTGALDFHTTRGLVSRFPQNGGKDVTTLVTFELSSQYSNNQCQFVFDMGNDSTGYVTGTGKAQLFTSLAPADQDTSTWPNGNLRNQNLGTINANAYGRATWDAGSGPGASVDGKFPCSEIAGYIYGGEVVPVGDADTISWVAGSGDGPKILVW